jgi:asparagine synthase (glutamine-hydrolysing)
MYFGAVPPQTRWGKLADVFQTRGDILGMYQTVYSLFTSNFRKKLQMNSATSLDYGMAHGFAEEIRTLIKGQGQLEAISNLELIFFIGQRLLRDTDAASMASSIEVRVPLLDHVLIEKASRIQPDKRYLPLGSKNLLRSSALSNLDPAIFNRPKSGFTLPFELWCRENLKDKVESLLTDKDLCHAVGLNVEATTQLFIAFQKKSPGIYWSRVWSIYCLLWWCKKHQAFL